MVSLQFQLLRELFVRHNITFVWRTSPGNEDHARVTMVPEIRIEPFSMFITGDAFWSMGAFSYSQSNLPPETSMGRYSSCANAINVFNSEHPVRWISTSPFSYNPACAPVFEHALDRFKARGVYTLHPFDDNSAAPLHIGNDVWIGQNVILKRGITIHDGAVVAAGAVVTADVEEFTIVGGVPAKPIRRRFSDDIIARVKELRWWRYKFTDFAGLNPTVPAVFLDGLEERIVKGTLREFSPIPVTLHSIKQHLEQTVTPLGT